MRPDKRPPCPPDLEETDWKALLYMAAQAATPFTVSGDFEREILRELRSDYRGAWAALKKRAFPKFMVEQSGSKYAVEGVADRLTMAGYFIAAGEHEWPLVGTTPFVRLTAKTKQAVNTSVPAKPQAGKAGAPVVESKRTMPFWWRADMPKPMQKFFQVLEKFPDGVATRELKDELDGREPSRFWSDYPQWKPTLRRFVGRKRGTYQLKHPTVSASEKASKNPVERQ